jgi:hypothetical protein
MAFVIRMLGIHRDHDHRRACCGDPLPPAEHVLVATRPPQPELRGSRHLRSDRSRRQCLLRMAQVEGDMRRHDNAPPPYVPTPENDLLQPGARSVKRTRWNGLAPGRSRMPA